MNLFASYLLAYSIGKIIIFAPAPAPGLKKISPTAPAPGLKNFGSGYVRKKLRFRLRPYKKIGSGLRSGCDLSKTLAPTVSKIFLTSAPYDWPIQGKIMPNKYLGARLFKKRSLKLI